MTKKSVSSFGQIPLFEERLIAFLVDCVIVFGVSMFPRIGWIFGLIYFLLKDSLFFTKGQSFGKKIVKIQAVDLHTKQTLVSNPQKALIRNLILLIPFLNLYELYLFTFKARRLGDEWSETTVIKTNSST